MSTRPEIRFDVASAMSQGRRDYQEDALATDFPLGAGTGIAVLSDGMGGHVAGDVASTIVVTEVFSDLKLRSGSAEGFAGDVPGALRAAVDGANSCLGMHGQAHPEAQGMGATAVALVFDGARLFWISVGDSPLFLYRGGALRQINEDHSLAPQIDYLVRSGLMDAETGRTHPDRSCLTSVLAGAEIERIDCTARPLDLQDGDVVVVASDGLLTLAEAQIEELVAAAAERPASEIAETLLAAVEAAEDPEQDNVSFAVIKPRWVGEVARQRLRAAIPAVLHSAASAIADRSGAAGRWLRGGEPARRTPAEDVR